MRTRTATIIVGVLLTLCFTSCGVNNTMTESINVTEKEEAVISLDESNTEAGQIDERYLAAIDSGKPTIILSNVEGTSCEDVEVTVSIVNNPGILGMSLTLSYDDSMLSLCSAENGEAFSDVLTFTNSEELKNGTVFLWDGVDIGKDEIKDGEILKMTFSVNEISNPIKSAIVLTADVGGTVDNELNPIDLTIDNGSVSLVNKK